MNDLRIERIDNPQQLAQHRTAWLQLWHALSDANPFYHPDMLLPAWQHLDAAQVMVYLVFDQHQLIALVPLQQRRRFRGAPANWLRAWGYIHCFSDAPLLRADHGATVAQALTAHWRQRGHALVSWLKLPDLADWPPGLRSDTLSQRRACLQPGASDYVPIEQALEKKKLKEFRRQWRRLGEQGQLRFEVFHGDAATERLAPFMALEAAGWKGASDTAMACHQQDQQFLQHFVQALAAQQLLRFYQLSLDGRPVAMLLAIANGEQLYLFKICFDESLARFSPGVLLMLECTRLWEGGEFSLIDSCAQQDHPMIDKLWRQKRTVRRHHLALGGPYGNLLLTLSQWITRWQRRKEDRHEHLD